MENDFFQVVNKFRKFHTGVEIDEDIKAKFLLVAIVISIITATTEFLIYKSGLFYFIHFLIFIMGTVFNKIRIYKAEPINMEDYFDKVSFTYNTKKYLLYLSIFIFFLIVLFGVNLKITFFSIGILYIKLDNIKESVFARYPDYFIEVNLDNVKKIKF